LAAYGIFEVLNAGLSGPEAREEFRLVSRRIVARIRYRWIVHVPGAVAVRIIINDEITAD
jgi:hypothetical protein